MTNAQQSPDRRGDFSAFFLGLLGTILAALGLFLYVNDQGIATLIFGAVGAVTGFAAYLRSRRR